MCAYYSHTHTHIYIYICVWIHNDAEYIIIYTYVQFEIAMEHKELLPVSQNWRMRKPSVALQEANRLITEEVFPCLLNGTLEQWHIVYLGIDAIEVASPASQSLVSESIFIAM